MSIIHASRICSNLKLTVFVTLPVVIAILLLQSSQQTAWPQRPEGSNSTSTTSPFAISSCYANKDGQPSRMTMNSVESPLSKVISVALDKQTYTCKISSEQLGLVEISTYSILIDDTRSLKPVERSIEVIACMKTLDGTFLRCMAQKPPDLPLPKMVCSSKELHPPNPMTFNTVGPLDNSSILRTMHADLDTYACRSENKEQLLKNVLSFSGIFYDPQNEMPEMRSVETITCVTNIIDMKVLTCSLKKIL